MKEDKAIVWSIDAQRRWKSKLRKLTWCEERFGDEAKYQGFDQGELVQEMIRLIILLRLTITALSHQIEVEIE